jgi:hypothetical protein
MPIHSCRFSEHNYRRPTGRSQGEKSLCVHCFEIDKIVEGREGISITPASALCASLEAQTTKN